MGDPLTQAGCAGAVAGQAPRVAGADRGPLSVAARRALIVLGAGRWLEEIVEHDATLPAFRHAAHEDVPPARRPGGGARHRPSAAQRADAVAEAPASRRVRAANKPRANRVHLPITQCAPADHGHDRKMAMRPASHGA